MGISVPFWLCLGAALVVFHVLGRTARIRAWVLLVLGLAYAATWGAATPIVIGGLAGVTYGIARVVERAPQRRHWLVLGVAITVAPLVVYKAADLPPPIGLSYVTFTCISYVIEAHDRRAPVRGRALDFLASTLFFPKLVAGPITRPTEILPQMREARAVGRQVLRTAVVLVVVGLAKKHLGDMLGGVVRETFELPASDLPEGIHFPAMGRVPTVGGAWIGALALAAQLYADFSGYTDIALGVALAFGIELPPNFRLPFLARSPIDFWSRWHISLSSWLRDHVFMPIAVRGRWGAPVLAVVVTMVLGGLWHQPSVKFVAWGLYQAVLILGTHAIFLAVRRLAPALLARRAVVALEIALTFILMLGGYILFRAPTVAFAWEIVRAMAGHAEAPSTFDYASFTRGVAVVAALVLPHLVDAWIARTRSAPERALPYWRVVLVGVLFLVATNLGTFNQVFIYGDF